MATRGRPRAFDRDSALRLAMDLFWAKGYDGTSLPGLTAAMGISAPSLYAAFGSKEALFREAVDLYSDTVGRVSAVALTDPPTAREGIDGMLRAVVRQTSLPGRPKGCLVGLGGIDGSPEDDAVRRVLIARRGDRVVAIRERLARGVADGDLPASADLAAITAFYAAMAQGITLQARDGCSRATLMGIVDSAMAAWPHLTAPLQTPSASRSRPARAPKTARSSRRAASV
jgi:AcrR family transcriptional regulator